MHANISHHIRCALTFSECAAQVPDQNGNTPLHIACEHGQCAQTHLSPHSRVKRGATAYRAPSRYAVGATRSYPKLSVVEYTLIHPCSHHVSPFVSVAHTGACGPNAVLAWLQRRARASACRVRHCSTLRRLLPLAASRPHVGSTHTAG